VIFIKYIYKTCPCGSIKGIGTESYYLFKGIRYAEAERWEAPKEVTGWDDTYDATYPGVWCYQRNSFISTKTKTGQFYADMTVEKQVVHYSEDCLNLNIWTPVDSDCAPVLVYIHGGSYETGGGSNTAFNGQAYCQQGIIVVTINYRLNAFASAVGEGYSGNYGLQDQVCALQWIRHNISAFGGDPERITVMGESAGAMSVQNLILTPLAKGLFCGAIMLSGGGIIKNRCIEGPQTAEKLWSNVCSAFGAKNICELKQIPPKELYCTWKHICESDPQYVFPARPVIDGSIIPDSPYAMGKAGNVNAVPAIIGLLSEDMWPLSLYQAAVEWGVMMAEANLPPVYGLFFDRAIPGTEYGAFHGADIRYAFGTLDSSWQPYEAIDYRVSRNMIEYFSNFIKTGVPRGNGLAKWCPITQEDKQFMHFGDTECEMCSVPEEKLKQTQALNKPFPGM